MYEMTHGVEIVTPQGNLSGLAEIKVKGKPISYPSLVPEEAKPDCVNCEKPELDPENVETVMVYQLVANQQTWNFVNGARLGLRLEAIIAAVRWMTERGDLLDPDTVLRRIWVIDNAINKHHNAKLDKQGAKEGARDR